MSFTKNSYIHKNKKCDLPMKLRRRQSDAKWRANVASCYETLKHIIPVNKRASRRQISKAHIIQQTSNHIQFLEEVMSSLLIEKAKKDGARNPEKWKAEKLEQIKDDFVNQHRKKLEHLNAEKRYKKKSYKLFIDDSLQENIQQNTQLREALFESHREITGYSDLEKGVQQTQINGVNVFTYAGDNSENCVRPTNTVQPIEIRPDGVDYDLPIMAPEGYEGVDDVPVLQEPVDYSSSAVPAPLDLTVNKTDHVDTDTAASVNQFGGHVFVTSAEAGGDTTSVQIVPETVITDQLAAQSGQQETSEQREIGLSEELAANLHLVPDLPDSTDIKHSANTVPSNWSQMGFVGTCPVSTPVKRARELDSTPRKLQKREEHTGFTPVKLPDYWSDCSTEQGYVPECKPALTPTKEKDIPVSTETLLCTEEMWMSSDEETGAMDQRQLNTPGQNHRRVYLRNLKRARSERSLRQRLTSVTSMSSDSGVKDRPDDSDQEVPEKRFNSLKCRRSLQRLYDSDAPCDTPKKEVLVSDAEECPSIKCSFDAESEPGNTLDDTLDFDGYLQFYKQMGADLKQSLRVGESESDHQVSRLIYDSWTNLPHGMKDSLKQLALTEQAGGQVDTSFCKSPDKMSGLDDLDTDIWPLPQDIDLNATDEDIFSTSPRFRGMGQLFEEMGRECKSPVSRQASPDLSLCLLPHSIVCSNDGSQLASVYPVTLETNTQNEPVDLSSASRPDRVDNQTEITLEHKDLFIEPEFLCSSTSTVYEEVQRYFHDFSPPESHKLTEFHG